MDHQTNRKKTVAAKLSRILLLAGMVLVFIDLLGEAIAWLILLKGGVSFSAGNAATIGIIGGADGPTAVFVTASAAPIWQTMLKCLLLVLGFFGLRQLKIGKGEE